MWVALEGERQASRVIECDREKGWIHLEGPEGRMTVPAMVAARGVLLFPVKLPDETQLRLSSSTGP